MSKILGATLGLLLVTTALATEASAATLLAANGTPLDEAIKNNHGVSNDGMLLTFASDPSGYLVDYSSSATLHYNGNSGGFAFVTGPTSGTGFPALTIMPETVTFTAFKFNLDVPASFTFTIPNGYQTDFTYDTTVFFSGGGSQSFTTDLGNGAGANRYQITAGTGQAIDKIVFSDLVGVSTRNNDPTLTNDYNFAGIRQASFDITGAVPEPATWVMFILGFGAIGLMLRAARSRGSLSLG